MGKRLSAVSKHVAIVVSLVAVPAGFKLQHVAAASASRVSSARTASTVASVVPAIQDPRIQRLHRFLNSLHCPVSYLAEDFIHAADDNHLDWRLLPSISVIESGGGKAYKNNNIFGWANGDYLFPTVRSAIHQVAFKLGKSSLYRNRDIEEKLHLYNPDEAYAHNVMAVMNRISPVSVLRPVSRSVRVPNQFTVATD